MRTYRTTLIESGSVWARLVSDVISPPVVWMVLGTSIAIKFASNPIEALLWSTIYAITLGILPVVYIALQVKRGKITDIHMKEREQRIRPFIFSIISGAVGWLILSAMDTPDLVAAFELFSMVQLLMLGVITMLWQISIHSMTICGAVVAAGAIFGNWWITLLLSPLVVLVGAARLRLSRHTPAQVIAGGALGALMSLLVFVLLPLLSQAQR
jgi:membrane-associated phospholipid phosphatase